jgi:glyoxylase-like metal-dependent hydrolase (beta-lactamase superfamily II)
LPAPDQPPRTRRAQTCDGLLGPSDGHRTFGGCDRESRQRLCPARGRPSFDVNLTTIYITHGHADHWIGLARLLQRFPSARGLATPEVVGRANFEATHPPLAAYWQGIFPGDVPAAPVVPEVLDGTVIDLEGNELRVLNVGRGDTEHSTVLHVPGIDAAVAGDIVYNQVHMMLAETDPRAREEWIAANDAIDALEPRMCPATSA